MLKRGETIYPQGSGKRNDRLGSRFLRAVNVGKRQMKMAELKALCEALGYAQRQDHPCERQCALRG